MKSAVTVENTIKEKVKRVWKLWTEPEHIKNWCNASEDWYVPNVENDLRNGGKFRTVMSAKDKSYSFDFEGVYTDVKPFQLIEYKINDGRNVKAVFIDQCDTTKVIETFEAESINPLETQRSGWQAILDNFAMPALLTKMSISFIFDKEKIISFSFATSTL